MDGIGLELWNKKLVLGRYQRLLAYKAFLDEARAEGPTCLYQAACDNLEVLVLHWKETFRGSWQRQKPKAPLIAADQAQIEFLPILSTEQNQIDHEIESQGTRKGISWKPEEYKEGKALLDRKVSILRADCLAQISDAKEVREVELESEKTAKLARKRDLRHALWITTLLVAASAFFGVGLGAYLNAKRSTEDRQFIDERMKVLAEGQRRVQEQLAELHRSNRKIAFWTEKTPEQIDKEMDEARDNLSAQKRDIQEETMRKVARMESEYARSGRDGGSEMELRKQGLLRLQSLRIAAAEKETEKKIDDLQSQKRNIQR